MYIYIYIIMYSRYIITYLLTYLHKEVCTYVHTSR